MDALAELKRNILGPLSVGYYLSAFFFSLLGILLMLYITSKKRDVGSTSTPVHFSWQFLLWDNTKRIFIGLIVMYLLFRFTTEFLQRELNMYVALGIGFVVASGVDWVVGWIKDRVDWLQQPREEYMRKLLEKSQQAKNN
jgi:hypothetical protein